MEVKNCRKCRKLFNYIAGPQICPQCREALEAKFQDVKKYVYDNKGATITQIAAACEVDVPQIQQWIREERLVFSSDSPITINCESCGEMIQTGRFCAKCKANVANGLSNTIAKPAAPQQAPTRTKDSPKMRFLQ